VPNTPNGLPYPLISDPPAVSKDIQNLATTIDPYVPYMMSGRCYGWAIDTSDNVTGLGGNAAVTTYIPQAAGKVTFTVPPGAARLVTVKVQADFWTNGTDMICRIVPAVIAGSTVPSATNTSAAPAPTSGTFNTTPASTVLDHSGARIRVQGTAVKPSITQHGEAVFTLGAGTWTAYPLCFREPRNDGTGSSTADQIMHPQCRVFDGGPA
jgi:type V secretory pathway adhesin AidA